MIVIFFIVIAAVNAINFHSVLESVDAECPKPCPECEWATLLLDEMHKLHATIDKDWEDRDIDTININSLLYYTINDGSMHNMCRKL